jgi:uncharacterized protein (TIGR04255 family)
MTFPHLPNAPIVEGLIHLRTKPRKGLSLEDLQVFGDKIQSNYPTAKPLQHFEAGLQIGPDSKPIQSLRSSQVGYRFERATPPFVIHAQIDELLISRLRPYDTWENLFSEARVQWSHYSEVCKPEAITRIATRFINRIDLPTDKLDFDDYLAAPPSIPKGLPSIFEHFLTRIVVPDETSGCHIAISQALDSPNPQTRTVPVLIDIDVYKEVELAIDSSVLWETLSRMRDLKNRAFFDSVTPKALELFR